MKRLPLLGILLGYAVLTATVQVHCTDLLSSDGESYLRIAAYTARGDFRHAIFGHWSPLGPWLTVPLVAAGMAPRHAFRLMIGLWGAAAVVGVWRLASRLGVRGGWQVAATACAAAFAAEFSAEHRVDLLLAALLLFYLDAAMDPRLLASRLWAARVGALGGLAYLAKLYALPFFALHFPLMLLAHGWRGTVGSRQKAVGRRQEAGRSRQSAEGSRQPAAGSRNGMNGAMAPAADRALPPASCLSPPADCLLPTADCARAPRSLWRAMGTAWLAGAATFALVAWPWVMALSLKYGRLTVGTAAAQTYVQFGPGAGDARHDAITGLRKPPAHAYNVWQDAGFDLPASTQSTSPFRSRAAFAEQMRTVWRNLGVGLAWLAGLDSLRLGLAAVALTPLALAVTWRRREAAFRHLVAAATLAVFCGGYAFIHADEERFFWFPLLLVVPISFQFVALAAGAVGSWQSAVGSRQSAERGPQREQGPRSSAFGCRGLTADCLRSTADCAGGGDAGAARRQRPSRPWAAALGLLAVGSFGWGPAARLRELFAAPPPGREHRLVARQLAGWGVRGPLASTGLHEGKHLAWHDGLHVAYYLDAQYAGMPASELPDRIVVAMRDAGARTLLVWDEPRLAAGLRAQPGLRPVGFIPAGSLTGLSMDVAVFALREES